MAGHVQYLFSSFPRNSVRFWPDRGLVLFLFCFFRPALEWLETLDIFGARAPCSNLFAGNPRSLHAFTDSGSKPDSNVGYAVIIANGRAIYRKTGWQTARLRNRLTYVPMA